LRLQILFIFFGKSVAKYIFFCIFAAEKFSKTGNFRERIERKVFQNGKLAGKEKY